MDSGHLAFVKSTGANTNYSNYKKHENRKTNTYYSIITTHSY